MNIKSIFPHSNKDIYKKLQLTSCFIVKYSQFSPIFTSQGNLNKPPKTEQHKRKEICFLMVLKVRSPKSKWQQELSPLKDLRNNSFLPLSMFVGPLHCFVCGSLTPTSTSIFIWLSSHCLSVSKSLFLYRHQSLDLLPI